MDRSVAAYILWWFLLGFLAKGDALKCYECKSTKQPECGQHFEKNAFTADDCPDDAYACALQRQDITVSDTHVVAILRGCYAPNMVPGLNSSNGCRLFTHADHKGNFTALYCFCNTDKCNHGPYHVSSSLLVGVALFTSSVVSLLVHWSS